MIVVGTGSRDWRHEQFVRQTLTDIFVEHGPFELYHGYCTDRDGVLRGADRHMDAWGKEMESHGIHVEPFPANWDLGNQAGPIRNRLMMTRAAAAQSRGEVVKVVAFRRRENSRGTNDALRNAIECGLADRQVYTEADVAANYRNKEET